ncbi:accessory gene regulator B family protein [Paenibacillus filicis]|uniref:accessory gene regulator B family protein n=1 Tax=Paenibacillus filicis TaxID=669464 RepID=UPI003BF9E243
MIGYVANRLAMYITSHNNRPDVPITHIKLTIHLFLNYFLVFLTLLMFGLFFGRAPELLLSFFSFVLIRTFSGSSWHFKNDLQCYLFSSFVLILFPLINFPINQTFIFIFSILLILVFSPSSARNKNLSPKKKYGFKLLSVLISVIIYFAFDSSAVTNILLLQSISLVPFTKKENRDA